MGGSSYLVKSRKNLVPQKIKELGFDSRELEKWVHVRLLNANLVPHGGGHKLIEIDGVKKVILYPSAKVIIPRISKTAYVDMETVFHYYRAEGILERIRTLELANPDKYLRDYLRARIDGKDHYSAYLNVGFEQEAYAYEREIFEKLKICIGNRDRREV